ncbi:MAG TPA: thiamine pyrophosphate-dependent enzyme [Acidobacteriota bacterium]|nr:thiamine pyrophosphate-dependent enzyme [Acidobacteriota bacterium]
MEVVALIDKVRHYEGKVPAPLKENEPLEAYAGKTPAELKRLLKVMLTARRVEREEKLLLRKGHNRFFIGCGGKELIDVALGSHLRPDDPWVGYYRNKAFDFYRGASLQDKMLEAIGDSRGRNRGQQIPAHPGYPDLAVIPQASPTGGHALEAAGIAEAISHPVPVSRQSHHPGGRYPGDAVTVCAIGEGSTSESEFARAVFYAAFYKARAIFAIYNCGWAISVSVEEQFPEGDPTTPFEGFQRFGLKILQVDGTDVKASLAGVAEAVEYCRAGNGPVLMNVRTTREGSHSGSDDQSFYMDPDEQDWHTHNDCILKTCLAFIEDGVIQPEEIGRIWDELDKDVTAESKKAVAAFTPKTTELIESLVYTYDFQECRKTWKRYRDACKIKRAEKFREFRDKGYFASGELPENAGPMTMRSAINYTLFDLFLLTEDVILFGEDVADFSGHMIDEREKQAGLKGKGGVFLVTKNLQREFGNDRCFNTPLDEAGILARASGHVYQGRRPLPEIQFLDYVSPAYQVLKDRICTTYQRSGGLFRMPLTIRTTYGGYKQGAGAFWHSEGNLGTWMNIPSLLIAVPSNAYDAAGLLKTAWACDDPVLFCESVALYNRRDWEGVPMETAVPDIDELIPFGVARVYHEDRTDIGIITYGATFQMCRRAAELVLEEGIQVRIVDLRTVKPMDEEAILQTARECGKVLVVTEDRFPGGTAATIASIITRGEGLYHLEAPIKLVTAIDARVAYGVDGDNACLPTVDKIVTAIQELHQDY